MMQSPNSDRTRALPHVGAPEPARPADLDPLIALLEASDLPAEDLTQRHLEYFRVCRMEGRPVAAIGLEVHGVAGLLRSLVVAPPVRGRGLGRALVRHLEDHAAEHGIDALYLLTTTADAFFARLGYRVIERIAVPPVIAATDEFARLCPSSAVCMTRALGGSPS